MRVQRQKTLVIEYMKIQISKIILLAWMILAVFSQLALADGQAPQTILQPLEELTVQTRSGEYKFTVEVADEPLAFDDYDVSASLFGDEDTDYSIDG